MRHGILSALFLAGLAGCGAPPSDTMISLPPPPQWEEALESYRAARDEGIVEIPDSPILPEDRETFEGLDYWEPDPAYYFAGPLHRYPQPEQLEILTTTGKVRPGEKYGWISFPLGEQAQTLQVYRMLDQPDGGPESYLVAFTDATSGDETYPAGRYVNLQGSEGGPYVLDFNLAHNPFCAYGAPERFACPRAPAENRLPVRIEAGERGYKHAASTE